MPAKQLELAERLPPNLRSLRIIEVLAEAGRPLTPTEINEYLDLPKPTVHRLCHTLLEQGFLARDIDPKRLKPARRLQTISSGVLNHSRVHAARHAIMKSISERIGETCNLSVPEQSGMVYVERVETSWPMRFQLPVGTSVPFHCTSGGKLFLSTLDRDKLKPLLQELCLEPLAKNTIVEPDALERELVEIRKRGFSRDNEEFIDNLIAIAVPVVDPRNRLFAALAFHAPIQRLDLTEAEQHVGTLKAGAKKLAEVVFGAES